MRTVSTPTDKRRSPVVVVLRLFLYHRLSACREHSTLWKEDAGRWPRWHVPRVVADTSRAQTSSQSSIEPIKPCQKAAVTPVKIS